MTFLVLQFVRLVTYMSNQTLMISLSNFVQLTSIYIHLTSILVKCLSFLVSSIISIRATIFNWQFESILIPITHVGFLEKSQELYYLDSPIENNTNLVNPGWTVQVSNFTQTQVYNHRAVTFYFMLERKRAGILMHFYLPSLILCLASTLSLFIHHDLLPARMSLSVTSCLSLITLIIGAK